MTVIVIPRPVRAERISGDTLASLGMTIGLIKIAVNQLQTGLERGGAGAFVVHGLQSGTVQFLQGSGDGGLGAEHTHGMGLEHADAVVIVNDEARETVALAVDQPVAVGGGRISQPISLAQLVSAR